MIAKRAYAEVERLTRRRARNFAYGIMLLPRPKRRAIAAIYAFARRVDDIGDGTMPDAAKLDALARERDGIAHLRAGVLNGHTDDTLVALAEARERFDARARAKRAA